MPKNNLTWFSKEELFLKVQQKLQSVGVLLDIGCGIKPQPFTNPIVHICVDPFSQYTEILQRKLLFKRSKKQFDSTYIVLKASWAEIVEILPPKSVDAIYLIDVIEHIEKKEVLKLLPLTEKVARQQIVILTPFGFMPQFHPDGKDVWGLDGGKFQTHKSGWRPEDFDKNWHLFASKDFYMKNNVGKKLEKPIGALWAIKNLKQDLTSEEIKQKNNDIARAWAITTHTNNPKFIKVMELVSTLENRRTFDSPQFLGIIKLSSFLDNKRSLRLVIFILNGLIKLEHYLFKIKMFFNKKEKNGDK
jgi:hypothetical protein